jgi:hypothetical protein
MQVPMLVGVVNATPCREIAQRILCKASRTTSGSDSYFSVQQLFSSDDKYLLKPRGFSLPPIDVEVILVNGTIKSTVSCINYYGLYSMEEIDDASQVGTCTFVIIITLYDALCHTTSKCVMCCLQWLPRTILCNSKPSQSVQIGARSIIALL